MSSVKDFLDNADYDSYPGMKFDAIGDGIKGVIVGKPRVVELDDDGEIRTNLVINVRVDAGKGNVGIKDSNGKKSKRSVEIGETVSVWVSAGGRARAVSKAVKAVNESELADGGEFSIRFTNERDTGQIQPAKDYEATYKAPAASTAVPASWGSDEEPF